MQIGHGHAWHAVAQTLDAKDHNAPCLCKGGRIQALREKAGSLQGSYGSGKEAVFHIPSLGHDAILNTLACQRIAILAAQGRKVGESCVHPAFPKKSVGVVGGQGLHGLVGTRDWTVRTHAKHIHCRGAYVDGACALGKNRHLEALLCQDVGSIQTCKACAHNHCVRAHAVTRRSERTFDHGHGMQGIATEPFLSWLRAERAGIEVAGKFHFPGKLSPEHGPRSLPALLHKLSHVSQGIVRIGNTLLDQDRGSPQGAEGALTGAHAKACAQAQIVQGMGGGKFCHVDKLRHGDHLALADKGIAQGAFSLLCLVCQKLCALLNARGILVAQPVRHKAQGRPKEDLFGLLVRGAVRSLHQGLFCSAAGG